jgi:hypothetical protein
VVINNNNNILKLNTFQNILEETNTLENNFNIYMILLFSLIILYELSDSQSNIENYNIRNMKLKIILTIFLPMMLTLFVLIFLPSALLLFANPNQ